MSLTIFKVLLVRELSENRHDNTRLNSEFNQGNELSTSSHSLLECEKQEKNPTLKKLLKRNCRNKDVTVVKLH